MKKGAEREWYVTIIIPIFTLVLIIIAVAVARKVNDAQIVNVALVAGLVGVTTWYSYSTAKMASEIRMQAEAAKQQAEASVKMAEEMEPRPYLLMRLKEDEEADSVWQWPSKFEVTIKNVGKGPAMNLIAGLWHRKKIHFFQERKGYLAFDEDWKTTVLSRTYGIEEPDIWLPELAEKIPPYCLGAIAVEYQDIHKRKWASYLCFEENVDVPGYVTEGEQDIVEVTQHD